MNKDTAPQRAWYRQFWPWFILTPPLIAVLAGIATVVIALRSPNPLVVDDYTTIALTTQRHMAREHEAARLGVSATLRLQAEQGRLRVSLEGSEPDSLVVRFVHPTRAEWDKSVTLHFDGEQYSGPLPALATGRWYLRLEPVQGAWRLAGEMYSGMDTVTLQPTVSESDT